MSDSDHRYASSEREKRLLVSRTTFSVLNNLIRDKGPTTAGQSVLLNSLAQTVMRTFFPSSQRGDQKTRPVAVVPQPLHHSIISPAGPTIRCHVTPAGPSTHGSTAGKKQEKDKEKENKPESDESVKNMAEKVTSMRLDDWETDESMSEEDDEDTDSDTSTSSESSDSSTSSDDTNTETDSAPESQAESQAESQDGRQDESADENIRKRLRTRPASSAAATTPTAIPNPASPSTSKLKSASPSKPKTSPKAKPSPEQLKCPHKSCSRRKFMSHVSLSYHFHHVHQTRVRFLPPPTTGTMGMTGSKTMTAADAAALSATLTPPATPVSDASASSQSQDSQSGSQRPVRSSTRTRVAPDLYQSPHVSNNIAGRHKMVSKTSDKRMSPQTTDKTPIKTTGSRKSSPSSGEPVAKKTKKTHSLLQRPPRRQSLAVSRTQESVTGTSAGPPVREKGYWKAFLIQKLKEGPRHGVRTPVPVQKIIPQVEKVVEQTLVPVFEPQAAVAGESDEPRFWDSNPGVTFFPSDQRIVRTNAGVNDQKCAIFGDELKFREEMVIKVLAVDGDDTVLDLECVFFRIGVSKIRPAGPRQEQGLQGPEQEHDKDCQTVTVRCKSPNHPVVGHVIRVKRNVTTVSMTICHPDDESVTDSGVKLPVTAFDLLFGVRVFPFLLFDGCVSAVQIMS